MNDQKLYDDAIGLLKLLISIPSFSKEENNTAAAIENFLHERSVTTERHLNNIWAKNKYFDPKLPTILLNSHHDTVKPNIQYKKDPFDPIVEEGKLLGLGSNDAGGCLVSLIAVFMHYYEMQNLKYNFVLAATAEEENSGDGGILSIFSLLPQIDFAIVGEPTLMRMAICERGLIVLDCVATGRAGHAARNEGENALYKAIKDIQWMTSYQFEKNSDLLGAVRMNVTVIETENKAHNMVPAQCKFVADIRVNEKYTFEEILSTIRKNVSSEVKERSTKMRSTLIPVDHPLIQAGIKLGLEYYGSPTTSDKAIMTFPALKMGPGDSARSHTADEYIFCNEIEKGIEIYIDLLNQIV
ncbi:MAG: M20 family metallo-hydrolase [Ginsengibacter sp.]